MNKTIKNSLRFDELDDVMIITYVISNMEGRLSNNYEKEIFY